MKVEKLIPEVYYKQSRDFSYIGRLLEIVFNYMRTGAECVAVNSNSPNVDATTIELIALTLGFESKHKYTTRDLIYIISSFSDMIRKKGTKEAINTAIKLLMNSQKIKVDLITDFVGSLSEGEDRFIFDIRIPHQLTDIILLEDLFDYILPAGVLYRLNRVTPQPNKESGVAIDLDNSYAYSSNYDTSQILSQSEGGYVYILLTDYTAPDDWDDNYENYYIYDSNNGFVQNDDDTNYVANKFYKKEYSTDIGTILTGTIAEPS